MQIHIDQRKDGEWLLSRHGSSPLPLARLMPERNRTVQAPGGEAAADALQRRALHRNTMASLLATYKYAADDAKSEMLAQLMASGPSTVGMESILYTLCLNSQSYYDQAANLRTAFMNQVPPFSDNGAIIYDAAADELHGLLPNSLSALRANGKPGPSVNALASNVDGLNLGISINRDFTIQHPFSGRPIGSYINGTLNYWNGMPGRQADVLIASDTWIKGLTFVGGTMIAVGLTTEMAAPLNPIGAILVLAGVIVETAAAGVDFFSGLGHAGIIEGTVDVPSIPWCPAVGPSGDGGYSEALPVDGWRGEEPN